MTNSDQVVHSFCIYEIKRHTYQPYVFRWTNFYENYSEFVQRYPEIQLNLGENELIICSTVIDADNYSLLTTRHLATKEKGIEDIAHMADITYSSTPINIKFEKFNYVFGTMQLKNEHMFRYFIEAGKACMVMEQGIRTLIQSRQMTDARMINLMRVLDKKEKANPYDKN